MRWKPRCKNQSRQIVNFSTVVKLTCRKLTFRSSALTLRSISSPTIRTIQRAKVGNELAYLRQRLFHLIPVFFLVTFASFMLINLLPGDVVDAILGDDVDAAADLEARAEIEKEYGLDKPVIIRYFVWLGDLVQGEMGRSYITGKKISDMLWDRIPVSFQLMAMSLTLALLIAIPLGLLSALKANQPTDRLISAGAFGVLATPPYVSAILFIYIFAVILQVLPAAGHVPLFNAYQPLSETIPANLQRFILPTLVIGLAEVPIFLRVLRVDMITTLQEDFIALAKAKGMSTSYILFRHAMRPASFTLITVIGLQVGRLISGLVIIESIFALPGMGKFLIDSIDRRDVLVVQAIVTFSALAYVFVNLAVDVLYAVLDPRVNRRAQEH